VYRARTVLQAEALAAALRAGGFEARVDQPNVAALLGPTSALSPGGVSVLVPTPQAEEATAIVRGYELPGHSGEEAVEIELGPERPADADAAQVPTAEPQAEAEAEPAPVAPPAPRTLRYLWGISALGAVFLFPFMTGCAMVYAAVLADRARRAAGRHGQTGSAVARAMAHRAWLAAAFNAVVLGWGVVVYAAVPNALDAGLVPFGPLVIALKPLIESIKHGAL